MGITGPCIFFNIIGNKVVTNHYICDVSYVFTIDSILRGSIIVITAARCGHGYLLFCISITPYMKHIVTFIKDGAQ